MDASSTIPQQPVPDKQYSKDELRAIAKRHGVDFESVKPLPKAQRLAKLREQLAKQDVRFPVDRQIADDYLQRYEANELFGVGGLSKHQVDLGEFANTQDYEAYTFQEHLSWACLVADQQATKHQYACREYLEGEELFEIGGSVIPDYYLLNARIYQQTAWQLATVNMIIPAELFFTCHSHRFFPVTTFMRALELDYLEEPDIGHDVAGHVATFTIPAVADVMVNHGKARDIIYAERNEKIKATNGDEVEIQKIKDWAEELLLYAGRLYWFTVEFGLVMQDESVRDFGAGILSSPGETKYSIASPESNRILIDPSCDYDLLRLATTDYLISEFQKTYFVMESFDLLASLTPDRIVNVSKLAMELPHYTWREIAPGDKVINVGRVMTSPDEKYIRLMANQSIDECLHRAAIRNLRITSGDFDRNLLSQFRVLPPEIPASVVEWFATAERENKVPEYQA